MSAHEILKGERNEDGGRGTSSPLLPSPVYKVLKLGNSLELRTVEELAIEWGFKTKSTAVKFLRALNVPLLHINRDSYFSVHALEMALFSVTEWGAKGFAAPGSHFRDKRYPYLRHQPNVEKIRLAPSDMPSLKEREALHRRMSEAAARRLDVVGKAVSRLLHQPKPRRGRRMPPKAPSPVKSRRSDKRVSTPAAVPDMASAIVAYLENRNESGNGSVNVDTTAKTARDDESV